MATKKRKANRPSGANGIGRREFIKVAAAGTAGVASAGVLVGCSPKEAGEGSDESATGSPAQSRGYYSWLGDPPVIGDSEIAETVEVDIVVVGGGNAGTMCACAAVEEGATVAVIEQQTQEDIFYYGLHDVANINSELVLSRGIPEIKKSEFVAEFQRRTLGKTNARVVKKFVDNSGPMLDWLYERMPQEA